MLLREHLSLPTFGADEPLSVLSEFATEQARSLKRLVILGSGEAALAMVRDARLHGLEPVVYDLEDGPAMLSRHALIQQAGTSARAGDRAALLRELRELGHPSQAALIPTTDDWLRRTLAQRAALADAYQRLLMPADDTLEVCLDKARFVLWCREQGISHPRSWCVGLEDRPADLRAPCVVRPALTRHRPLSDRPAHLVRPGLPAVAHASTEDALAELIARHQSFDSAVVVSESLLDRPLLQYSVCFARRPGRFLGFVTERIRPTPGTGQAGTYVGLRDEPGVLAFGRQIAERLDFHGIGEIEILHDRSTGKHHVVEVNARPWTQYALASASGHDLLRVVTGVRARELPRGRSRDVHWWMPGGDVAALLEHPPEGPLAPLRTLVRLGRAAARANVYGRLDWTDPLPALYPALRRWRR